LIMSKEKNVKRIEAVKELTKGNAAIILGNYIYEGTIYHEIESISIHEIIQEIEFFSHDELDYLYHHDEICFLLYNCVIIDEPAGSNQLKIHSGNSSFEHVKFLGTWYVYVCDIPDDCNY
jgi:hypothetical protein